MAGENDFSPIGNQVLNGGDGSSNPSVISDFLGVIEGDIQIGPDKDLLALQISGGEVTHALLCHGNDTPDGLGGSLDGSELGGDMVGE